MSRALGVECHLFRFKADARGIDVPPSESDASLQDATAFHLFSEESLRDLSARAKENIAAVRFRPNLLVAGVAPYAEDAWRTISVSGHRMHWVRPCTRCVLTTTDPLTGARPTREPLRTLATYRRIGSNVVFGHYFTCDSRDGVIRVGDDLEVLP
jgi:uncharacterized protein YcbX